MYSYQSKKGLKHLLFGALPASNSAKNSINSVDLKKILRVLIVTLSGAAATAGMDFLAQFLTDTDFGKYQIIVAMVINSGLLEMMRRYIADHLT